MKRIIKVFCVVLGIMFVFLGYGCAGETEEVSGIKLKMQNFSAEASGGVIEDSMGHLTFASGNDPVTVWGVENDQWDTMDISKSSFDSYIESSLYVNANAIAIHMPWAVVEPQKGVYNLGESSYLQYCVDKAKEAGLKIVVYFTSVNYASGDGTFLPNYILEDKKTYTRLYIDGVYDGNSETIRSEVTMCINDEDTLERERLALEKLMAFLEKNNDDGSIVAINIGSEVDYTHYWNSGNSINTDVRCECDICNALYRKGEGHEEETPYEFMLRSYLKYLRDVVNYADECYRDIAKYSPVAALTWFIGGRYVEQPDLIKAAVNLKNHFVCPSIAPTSNYAMYEAEMEYFIAIDGNEAFASGIDTAYKPAPNNNQAHLEIAPWYSILKYGGLGAIYWDAPNSTPTDSITTCDTIRERLRLGWAPLKATEYYISRFKGDEEVLNWWSYEENKKSFGLGKFNVSVSRSEEDSDEHNNYGIALLMNTSDLVLAPTTYAPAIGENNDITVTVEGGVKGFKFEKGYFDAEGNWIKTGSFKPEVSSNTLTISVESSNGDYTGACYRIYK